MCMVAKGAVFLTGGNVQSDVYECVVCTLEYDFKSEGYVTKISGKVESI